VAFWDNIARELRNLWETFRTAGEYQEPEPEEETEPDEATESPDEGGFLGDFFGGGEPEERPETGGGFFGGGEPPDESPPSGYYGADDGGIFTYEPGEGPYPEYWGSAEERFWDRQMGGHIFDNQTQYDQAQEYFYLGYMAGDDVISHEDRVQAREDFLDETYFDAIDWDAFADYYSETT
jgi:hypothetical protein